MNDLLADLGQLDLSDGSPDSRAVAASLVAKYGLRNIEKLKIINSRVPLAIPAAKRLEVGTTVIRLQGFELSLLSFSFSRIFSDSNWDLWLN
jgi:hypothetical protein